MERQTERENINVRYFSLFFYAGGKIINYLLLHCQFFFQIIFGTNHQRSRHAVVNLFQQWNLGDKVKLENFIWHMAYNCILSCWAVKFWPVRIKLLCGHLLCWIIMHTTYGPGISESHPCQHLFSFFLLDFLSLCAYAKKTPLLNLVIYVITALVKHTCWIRFGTT